MPQKRDGDTNRALRVLRLFRLLFFTGRRYSLAHLAAELDCSKQTVLSMVDQINASNIGVVNSWQADRLRWFQASPLSERPRLTLNPSDIQNLSLCRDLASHLLPDGITREVGESIGTATTLLPKGAQVDEANALDGLVASKGFVDYSPKQDILEVLLFALANHRVCRVTYCRPDKPTPNTYPIAPRALVAEAGALYANCSYVHRDGHVRPDYDDMTLAVHRIAVLEATDQTFTPREQRVECSPFFGFPREDPFRVTVRLGGWARTHAKERVWSSDQVYREENDEWALLEFTATSWPEVETWILGFGANVEVLAPEALHQNVRKALKNALSRYNPKRAGV